MIVEQMLKNAQTPLLHIADVSGSALFNADCMDILPLIPDKSIDVCISDPPYGLNRARTLTLAVRPCFCIAYVIGRLIFNRNAKNIQSITSQGFT